jgi:flagellin-like hook-associated protein FlgL
MTYTPGISFLGQSTTQIARLKQLNTTLVDLQRQLTTQKKFDNISGFGAQAYSVQKLRTDKAQLDSFLTNVSVSTFYKYGATDVETVSLVARQQLDLMRDVANLEIDGRYTFAGSATDVEPFSNYGQVDLNMQNLVSDWQAGTITTAQLIASFNAFSDTDLGFNPALSAAAPTATTDRGNAQLGVHLATLETTETQHLLDSSLFNRILIEKEDADTTEVVAKIQSLQTQLTSAYEVTSLVSKLSLVNFL